jgi:hypothetical protein
VSVRDGSVIDAAWAALPAFAVTSKVYTDDGTTPMGGARVAIRSQQILKAGKVTVDAAIGDAAGTVVAEVASAQDGSLPALSLPAGEYDLVGRPPDGALDGVTAVHQALSQAASWTIRLMRPTQLKGRVTDVTGAAVGGARVSAAPIGGLGAAPATTTDVDGRYALALEPGLRADLFVDPPLYTDPNRHAARGHAALAAGQAAVDVQLGKGLLLRGTIQRPMGGAPVAGAAVEARCAACNDATPAGVAITGGDGGFTMYLPDPGQ